MPSLIGVKSRKHKTGAGFSGIGALQYSVIINKLYESGIKFKKDYEYYWDDIAYAPVLYNPKTKRLIPYENVDSVRKKHN